MKNLLLVLVLCASNYSFANLIQLGNSGEITNSYLHCDVSGSEVVFGQGIWNGRKEFSQKMLVTIGKYEDKIVFFRIESLDPCDTSLFRCKGFASFDEHKKLKYKDELKAFDSFIAFSNTFYRDISLWSQGARLNRFSLFLEVHTQREYVKKNKNEEDSGLSVTYSGSCRHTEQKV